MKITIIGSRGQLGTDMVQEVTRAGHDVYAVDFPDIDITCIESIRDHFKHFSPEIVINCTGYTNVDACEGKRDEAFVVNAEGPGLLATCAKECDATLIHFSTDYVFDGTKGSPYTETDTPNPQSVYGKSKYEGELRVADTINRHFIFRISWLYGIHGNNFVKTIRRVATQKRASNETLKVVSDQYGSPTYTMDVCRQIVTLLDCTDYGVYHCTSEGRCTWYDFAMGIVNAAGITVQVAPCTTDEFPRPAPRPPYSVLENEKLKLINRNNMPEWQEGFKQFLADEKTMEKV